MWAPALMKTNRTWHAECIAGRAHCDHRLELQMDLALQQPPEDDRHVHICKRCKAIEPSRKR